MAGGHDLCATDVIGALRAHFDQLSQNVAGQVADKEARYRLLARAAKRFRVKRGANLMRRSTEQRMDVLRADIASGEQALEHMAKARDLLDDYEFDFDKPPPRQAASPMMTSFHFMSGTTR